MSAEGFLASKKENISHHLIEENFGCILDKILGRTWRVDENTKETHTRAAKALCEMVSGYNTDVRSLFKTFPTKNSDLVIVRDIVYHSLCCHHLVPFYGLVHIAYIPGESVLGLSKFARIVEAFSRKLQIQENMTCEIADSIQLHLKPKGVAVYAVGKHMCMCSRGVRSPVSTTQTQALRGVFQNDQALKSEMMSMLSLKNEIL